MALRASIFCFYLLFLGCSEKETILNGLLEQQANEILIALHGHGIIAEKKSLTERKNRTFSIIVKKGELNEALKIITINQLPRYERPGFREIFGSFKEGLIPSKTDEKARLNMAIQGELEALIKIIPGVIDTKVVLSIDRNMGIHHEEKQKASVAVIVDSSLTHEPVLMSEIQTLVSSSMSALEKDDVAVIIKTKSAPSYVLAKNIEEEKISGAGIVSQKMPYTDQILFLITLIALILAAYGLFRIKYFKK